MAAKRKIRVRVTYETIAQFQRMRNEGMTVRKIAPLLGIAYDTALAINQGKHSLQRGDSGRAELERCPGCGGLTVMPCLACYTKGMRNQR